MLYRRRSQAWLTPPARPNWLHQPGTKLKAGDIVCGWSPAGVIVSGSAPPNRRERRRGSGSHGGGLRREVDGAGAKSNNPTLMIDTSGLERRGHCPFKAHI